MHKVTIMHESQGVTMKHKELIKSEERIIGNNIANTVNASTSLYNRSFMVLDREHFSL